MFRLKPEPTDAAGRRLHDHTNRRGCDSVNTSGIGGVVCARQLPAWRCID
jgi:hypothetical protein